MSRSRLFSCAVASAFLLGGGLWLCDLTLQPIPMPLGGAALFGWAGFWLFVRRRPIRGLAVGFAIGAMAGVVMHVRSHVVEDRVEGIWVMTRHVLGDLGLGALGAALALVVSLAWVAALLRKTAR